MKETQEGLVLKTSRISYVHNYFLIVLFSIIIFLVYPLINLRIWWHFVALLAMLLIMVVLFEEPEVERLLRYYTITNTEVTKIEGILRKKKYAIPYQSVADVTLNKSIIGRIFNFGTIDVIGFKEGIKMKGMKNPDEIYNMIKQRIGSSRAFHPRARKEEKE